jgi:hypothetical protein
MAGEEATTLDMANVIASALANGGLAVAAEEPPKAEVPAPEKPEKPEATAKPEAPPAPEAPKPPDVLAETQRQLATLSENMSRLTETLATERERAGERVPQTPSELEKLSKDPQATEEARLVATELLGIRESLRAMQLGLDSQIQQRYNDAYEAEKQSFAEKYPKFSAAEIKAIDKAFGDAVERNPALADALTFEEFAARHHGGYDALLARRAPKTPRGEDPVVPGGKPPARVVTESATGAGRASLGKPLDRHASQDDVAARISAGLLATR